MDECIDSLGEAKILSTLDCNSGFWQVPIREEDKDKTTFVCHHGSYRYNRMPFGLMNAPATFQRALDIILAQYKWQTCLIYIDDIIIFSNDEESHFKHVDQILSALSEASVTIKLKKFDFFTNKVKYLGHVISPGKLEIDGTVTRALKDAVPPVSKTENRSFLGLCNVYRRFVKNFAKIAKPLNDLLKKEEPDKFGELNDEQIIAFNELRNILMKPPILSLPVKGRKYTLDCDASNHQIGAVLFQTDEKGNRHPLGYWSRGLNSHEKNYTVTEKECLAVVWAVTTLRPYLQFVTFSIYTDHAPLRWLMNISDPSGRLIRWRLRLSEFDFIIEYKRGNLNTQADAVSRLRTLGSPQSSMEDEDDLELPCFTMGDYEYSRSDIDHDDLIVEDELQVYLVEDEGLYDVKALTKSQ